MFCCVLYNLSDASLGFSVSHSPVYISKYFFIFLSIISSQCNFSLEVKDKTDLKTPLLLVIGINNDFFVLRSHLALEVE